MTPGHICFIWTYMQFRCSLFDFCAIYLTIKTLLVHYCAPFIRRIQNVSEVILKYTITCHAISAEVGIPQ